MKKTGKQFLLAVVTLLLLGSLFGCRSKQLTEFERRLDYIVDKENGFVIINGRGLCTSTDIVIPKTLEGYPVTAIQAGAFLMDRYLKSITIPDSVTSIGADAFYDCTGLTSVYITDLAAWCGISFDSEDANPLTYTENLYLNGELVTDLVIPDSVTSIGEYAFSYCSSLTSVTIPNSVTSIGNYAFSGCSSLTSVTIPNSVTSIGSHAFYYCTGLTSVTIGNSVTSIGSGAFYKCTGLTSVTIPDSVTSIEDSAFSYCSSLTSVTIPNSVTSIGNWAFEDCSSLTSITIPNSVTSIEYDAFSGCTGLTSVTIPDSVTSIGRYAFEGCKKLTNITYQGTKAQWNAISKRSYWNSDTGSYTITCTDGTISK